jgi:hypothetical protein
VRRAKLRQRLAHLRDLDQRYARLLPPGEHTVPAIASRLRAAGAPVTCYLLAEDEPSTAANCGWEDALEAVIGRGMGAFVSCLAGECNQHFGARQRGPTSQRPGPPDTNRSPTDPDEPDDYTADPGRTLTMRGQG